MENVKNYLASNQRLIQSMVIKSELHAQLLNEEIKLKHPNHKLMKLTENNLQS